MRRYYILPLLVLLLALCGCRAQTAPISSGEPADLPTEEPVDEKPVIYLYPTETTEVTVSLDYTGTVSAAYPELKDGAWQVTAAPDGTLTADGRTYPYLFWEGHSETAYDFRRGFVVPGEGTAAFLEEKLAYLGLSDTEAADFITYWLPRMQDNEYNLIAFQGRAYTDAVGLTVEPAPDTVIRVFMAWKPVDGDYELPEQELPHHDRSGFTLVEWGGTELP